MVSDHSLIHKSLVFKAESSYLFNDRKVLFALEGERVCSTDVQGVASLDMHRLCDLPVARARQRQLDRWWQTKPYPEARENLASDGKECQAVPIGQSCQPQQ